jgi:tRNA threonylcarbamoyl adenosine modification protein YeaZ
MKKEVILAIETGIGGGSLCILENNVEIASWEGTEKNARSEDLLSNISNLLSKIGLKKNHIKQICVSIGPGSFTGVRTGISTAKGLQKSLGIKCFGINILESITFESNRSSEIYAGFATGNDEICSQKFYSKGNGKAINLEPPQIDKVDFFLSKLNSNSDATLVLYNESTGKTLKLVEKLFAVNFNFILTKHCLAHYIGLNYTAVDSEREILPIYARESKINL